MDTHLSLYLFLMTIFGNFASCRSAVVDSMLVTTLITEVMYRYQIHQKTPEQNTGGKRSNVNSWALPCLDELCVGAVYEKGGGCKGRDDGEKPEDAGSGRADRQVGPPVQARPVAELPHCRQHLASQSAATDVLNLR